MIDINKYSIDATQFKFHESIENNIVFYNGGKAVPDNEVMRIDRNGIRVNPKFSTDKATDGVIRALDSYIKELARKEYERGFKEALKNENSNR